MNKGSHENESWSSQDLHVHMALTIVAEIVGHVWFPVLAPQVFRPCATSLFFLLLLSMYIPPPPVMPRAISLLLRLQKHQQTAGFMESSSTYPQFIIKRLVTSRNV
jgi:hypothetical protein